MGVSVAFTPKPTIDSTFKKMEVSPYNYVRDSVVVPKKKQPIL